MSDSPKENSGTRKTSKALKKIGDVSREVASETDSLRTKAKWLGVTGAAFGGAALLMYALSSN